MQTMEQKVEHLLGLLGERETTSDIAAVYDAVHLLFSVIGLEKGNYKAEEVSDNPTIGLNSSEAIKSILRANQILGEEISLPWFIQGCVQSRETENITSLARHLLHAAVSEYRVLNEQGKEHVDDAIKAEKVSDERAVGVVSCTIADVVFAYEPTASAVDANLGGISTDEAINLYSKLHEKGPDGHINLNPDGAAFNNAVDFVTKAVSEGGDQTDLQGQLAKYNRETFVALLAAAGQEGVSMDALQSAMGAGVA